VSPNRSNLNRHTGPNQNARIKYLKVLELAAKESEAGVDAVLRVLLAAGDERIRAGKIEAMLGADHNTTVHDVQVAAVDLSVFDQLYSAPEVLQ
jgi:hypothetical protein